MRTGVVAADIAALNTSAGMTLTTRFFNPQQSVTRDALNKIDINTTAVHDSAMRKIDIVTAGKKRNAVTKGSISKTSGKLPHYLLVRQRIADMTHPAPDFTIIVKKTDNAALSISGKFLGKSAERLRVPDRSIASGQHNWIVTPHHPRRPYKA